MLLTAVVASAGVVSPEGVSVVVLFASVPNSTTPTRSSSSTGSESVSLLMNSVTNFFTSGRRRETPRNELDLT